MSSQASVPANRGQGQRAGVDRARVIAAARAIGASGLTMQAVADELGVDRKTINHHVQDRGSLLRLAALAAFTEATATARIPDDATWQQAVRIFARAFTTGMIAAGEFADHLDVDGELIACVIDLAESLAMCLSRAAFSEQEAVRVLAQVANLCMSHARDVTGSRRRARPSRPEALRDGLLQRAAPDHPQLHRILAAGVDTSDATQFDLTLETFIAGTAAVRAGPQRVTGERGPVRTVADAASPNSPTRHPKPGRGRL